MEAMIVVVLCVCVKERDRVSLKIRIMRERGCMHVRKCSFKITSPSACSFQIISVHIETAKMKSVLCMSVTVLSRTPLVKSFPGNSATVFAGLLVNEMFVPVLVLILIVDRRSPWGGKMLAQHFYFVFYTYVERLSVVKYSLKTDYRSMLTGLVSEQLINSH